MRPSKVVPREERIASRGALLAKEKVHMRDGDALAAERRALPWVKVARRAPASGGMPRLARLGAATAVEALDDPTCLSWILANLVTPRGRYRLTRLEA